MEKVYGHKENKSKVEVIEKNSRVYPEYANGEDISEKSRTSYRVVGNEVIVHIACKIGDLTARQEKAIFKLPDELIPDEEYFGIGMIAGTCEVELAAKPFGAVVVTSTSSVTNAYIVGNLIFPIPETE